MLVGSRLDLWEFLPAPAVGQASRGNCSLYTDVCLEGGGSNVKQGCWHRHHGACSSKWILGSGSFRSCGDRSKLLRGPRGI